MQSRNAIIFMILMLAGFISLRVGLFARSSAFVAAAPFHADIKWPQISLTAVFNGLDRPVHVTHAGDGSGRLFIVEQRGRILVTQNGAIQPVPFLDITDRVSCCGEQGLLSVAFPPDYAQKGYFYVDYTDKAGDTWISRFYVTMNLNVADSVSEERILFIDQSFANHNGGQLAFGPNDDYLYIGMGDGGAAGDPQNNAQNPNSLLGKLLRIDVESGVEPYAIPSTNPFTQTAGFRGEIWAWGLRNPWRFAFDPLTGDLYIGDVGQGLWEEVDYQPGPSAGGENYGWRITEGAHCYNAPTCDQAGLTLPVWEYSHSQGCSITGGVIYRGTAYPRMNGVYFYADYCSGRIWGLQRDAGVWENTLLSENVLSRGIVSFGADEAGNIYLADVRTGTVYLITDSVAATPTPQSTPALTTTCFRQGENAYASANDANISFYSPTLNQGSDAFIRVKSDGNVSSLLRFDLSRTSAGQQVVSATLSIYAGQRDKAFPITLSAYRVFPLWEETEVTWNQSAAGISWAIPGANGLGRDRAGISVGTATIDSAAVWTNLDVTNMASEWVTHPDRNAGLILTGAGPVGVLYNFHSAQHWVLNQRPQLCVAFSPPPTPIETPSPSATATAGRTPTVTATVTPSLTPMATDTPAPSRTPTDTVTPNPTKTPTATPWYLPMLLRD